jgi:ABC-type proline/glycine betaine transport system permease subunit
MRIVQKVAIAVVAALIGIGLLGSPASADSSWGGCCGVGAP